jgi:hypothetical protein
VYKPKRVDAGLRSNDEPSIHRSEMVAVFAIEKFA